MKKIKYVQLEPAAVLLDFLSSRMTAEQFGCYWLIMMNLYCQAGKLEFDLNELGMLCNRSESFEKIWEKIESKFQIKNGFIKHKRVTAELRRAKRFLQHQRQAGLKGAQKRWGRYGKPNGNDIAKESKEKESKGNNFFGKKGFSQSSEKKNETCLEMMERMIAEGTWEQ
ncbi:MAG: hypothetical protein PVG93_00255 [Phycisphaerales bacterium]|jgi:uncharacterized protein YdaU (DUF1376 family)